jgi:hypothetical protein
LREHQLRAVEIRGRDHDVYVGRWPIWHLHELQCCSSYLKREYEIMKFSSGYSLVNMLARMRF